MKACILEMSFTPFLNKEDRLDKTGKKRMNNFAIHI